MVEKKDDAVASDGSGRRFTEVSGEFHTFDQPGSVLEGELVSREEIRIAGTPSTKYRLRKPDGTMTAFHGSADLDDKLVSVYDGFYIRITRMGMSEKAARSGNHVIQFKVETAE